MIRNSPELGKKEKGKQKDVSIHKETEVDIEGRETENNLTKLILLLSGLNIIFSLSKQDKYKRTNSHGSCKHLHTELN